MERDFQFDWQEVVAEALRRRKAQNLTQRRLAALSNVSLPTVVRFEKNRRDIQLSSVLAILNALGLTARKIEGSLLIRGGPDGPFDVRFAPLAGAGRPLETRTVPDREKLEGLFEELQIEPASRRLAEADLVRNTQASITGLQLSARQARALWPVQFGESG